MKKLSLLVILIACAAVGAFSQSPKITTFILLRHAEKVADGSQDPELAPEGLDRAVRLANLFRNTSVSAIYSTNFKRTRNTVSMLAKEKQLEVKLYSPSKGAELEKMLSENEGGTIVVVGHSNTIPGLANYLTGRSDFQNFPDAEHGNIIIVPVVAIGKSSNVVWFNY
jgi:2,3-bisphosphoglycerate-dependent phosphoglycerate mutase